MPGPLALLPRGGERSERIKFCVAFRPGLMSPVFATQQVNTFDALTGGRLTVNVVAGSTPVGQKRYGDHLDHDARYERTEEFLDIAMALWRNEGPVNYQGVHYQIEDATLFAQPATRPHPPVYLGAGSEAGRRVGAKHADVHMMWAVEAERVAGDVADMKRRAAAFGRDDLRVGVRLHVLCRETNKEARRAAEALIEGSELTNTSVWSDQRDREKYWNEALPARAAYFQRHSKTKEPPCSTGVQVAGLMTPDMMIEMDATAVFD